MKMWNPFRKVKHAVHVVEDVSELEKLNDLSQQGAPMSEILVRLVKSKRTWIAVVTLAVHVAHHFSPQLQFSDSAIDSIADQLMIAAGTAAVIWTKVSDSKQALPAPQGQ